jgi:hypothetical protein
LKTTSWPRKQDKQRFRTKDNFSWYICINNNILSPSLPSVKNTLNASYRQGYVLGLNFMPPTPNRVLLCRPGWFQTCRWKQFSCRSFSSSWNYRHTLPCPACNFIFASTL